MCVGGRGCRRRLVCTFAGQDKHTHTHTQQSLWRAKHTHRENDSGRWLHHHQHSVCLHKRLFTVEHAFSVFCRGLIELRGSGRPCDYSWALANRNRSYYPTLVQKQWMSHTHTQLNQAEILSRFGKSAASAGLEPTHYSHCLAFPARIVPIVLRSTPTISLITCLEPPADWWTKRTK